MAAVRMADLPTSDTDVLVVGAGPTGLMAGLVLTRRECLDGMLIAGERHLRFVLREYTDHYNTHRPHRTLNQNPPAGRTDSPAESASIRVLRRDRLGGLIHEYAQVA